MTRRTNVSGFMIALVLLAAAGCSLITDAPLTTARVEVDPTPVRIIRYISADGSSWSDPEVTTQRLDEIECRREIPRCYVQEAITVTIHNTGAERLELHPRCDFLFEAIELYAWRAVHFFCIGITPPVVLPPGEAHIFYPDMWGIRAGKYRVRFDLRDAAGTVLPDRMRNSEPFHYQPLTVTRVMRGIGMPEGEAIIEMGP